MTSKDGESITSRNELLNGSLECKHRRRKDHTSESSGAVRPCPSSPITYLYLSSGPNILELPGSRNSIVRGLSCHDGVLYEPAWNPLSPRLCAAGDHLGILRRLPYSSLSSPFMTLLVDKTRDQPCNSLTCTPCSACP